MAPFFTAESEPLIEPTPHPRGLDAAIAIPIESDPQAGLLDKPSGWPKLAILAGVLLFAAAIGLGLLAGSFTASGSKIKPAAQVQDPQQPTTTQGLDQSIREADTESHPPVRHAAPVRQARPLRQTTRVQAVVPAPQAFDGFNEDLKDRIEKVAEPQTLPEPRQPAVAQPSADAVSPELRSRIDQRLKLRELVKTHGVAPRRAAAQAR